MCKNGRFCTSKITKVDFTWNQCTEWKNEKFTFTGKNQQCGNFICKKIAKNTWNQLITAHSVEISWFSITQILREINFGDFRSAKSAIFHIWGLWTFIFMNFCSFLALKAEINKINQIQSPQKWPKGQF